MLYVLSTPQNLRDHAWDKALAHPCSDFIDFVADERWPRSCRSVLLIDRRTESGEGRSGLGGRLALPAAFWANLTSFLSMEAIDHSLVSLDRLPFATHVRIFASSSVVLGSHGGGLSSMIFSPPGTTVIELAVACIYCAWPCYVNLAIRLGHRFHRHSPVEGEANVRTTPELTMLVASAVKGIPVHLRCKSGNATHTAVCNSTGYTPYTPQTAGALAPIGWGR